MPTPPIPRTLDLRFRVARDHDLRVVERPGLRLDAEACVRLVDELRRVADRCIPGGTLRYGVLSGCKDRLDRVVVAVLYERSTGRPLGFNAMTWMEVTVGGRSRNVLHAGLVMIDPETRRGGCLGLLSAAPALVAFARNGLRPLWVSNVTQVPAVAGRFANAVADVFPAPGREAPPTHTHVELAAQIMARHRDVFGVGDDAELDLARFVIRNAYTGGSDDLKKSWTDACKHRDERFNRLCRELLDYDRGDDLLQIGTLTVGVVATLGADFVRRIVRRKARERRPVPFRAPTRLKQLGRGVS